MNIEYHRRFVKNFDKLDKATKRKVVAVLDVFKKNPTTPKLKNHKLSGHLKGKRAIRVDYGLRIVFEEFDGYTLVIMLKIDGHDRAYR